jgi:hypothetical protein
MARVFAFMYAEWSAGVEETALSRSEIERESSGAVSRAIRNSSRRPAYKER